MINFKDFQEKEKNNLIDAMKTQGYLEFELPEDKTLYDKIEIFKAFGSMHSKTFCIIDDKVFFGTEDKEYIIEQVTGKEYSEYERLNSIECNVELKDKIFEYQEKGKDLFEKDKLNIWNCTVPIRLKSEFKGKVLDYVLEILTLYKNGEEYKHKFSEIENEEMLKIVKNMIYILHNEGKNII